MHSTPSIHFDEFCFYTTHSENDAGGFVSTQRVHPDFGRWNERHLNLGHIRIYEHRADLKQKVDVRFDDRSVKQYVHHCISVEGELAANFLEYNVSAKLTDRSFHNLFLPGETYFLGMGEKFVNVHVEIDRDYYVGLLSDSESWSDMLREKILQNKVFYPGEFKLSAQMLQTIHAIFNSTLSGSLKKLLIEAKVHELIALQLYSSSGRQSTSRSVKNDRDLFLSVKEYLDDTFLANHSLKTIARHFALNEFSLKKGFRQNFETTVFDYILLRRLEHSHMLLLNTDQPIQQISSTVGYKYPHHFSVAFKKKFGVTPGALRAD